MKQIQAVSIWDNGTNQSAEILNAYAVNVTLGISATFYYSLLSATKQTLASGNLTMSGDAYSEWSNNDEYALEWIAGQLNLVIVGDWVEPVVEVVKENLTTEILNPETDTKI
jgi:hypothetical protein